MLVEIRHRHTGAVIHAVDLPDGTDFAVRAAVVAANLRDSNLRGANLSDSDLSEIRRDVEHILFCHAAEVPALLAALRAGEVDGSTYKGSCACLVGTLANAAGVDLDASQPEWEKDHRRPAEMFFTAIRSGDRPETNAAAKAAEGWIVDWQRRFRPVGELAIS